MAKSFEYSFEYTHDLGDGWNALPIACKVEIVDRIHGWDIGTISIEAERGNDSHFVELAHSDALTRPIIDQLKSQHEMEISHLYAIHFPDTLSDIRHSQMELA